MLYTLLFELIFASKKEPICVKTNQNAAPFN